MKNIVDLPLSARHIDIPIFIIIDSRIYQQHSYLTWIKNA